MNMQQAGKLASGYWQRLESCSLETLFLALFLIFGALLVIIIPPGWNTDETNHVYRAYQLSTGDVLSEQVVDPQTGLKAFGGSVPTNLMQLFQRTGASLPGTLGNPAYKIDKQLYTKQPGVRTVKDDGHRTMINFSGAALYSPVTYALYLPVFWLGKLMSLPFFWVIIIGRLVGLLSTGLAFFFAIRLIPIGKWIFFTIGLLPSVLSQAGSIGADAPQLAVTVLFVVAIVRLLFLPRTLHWYDYCIFLALSIPLALIKLAYMPVLLLLLLLPIIKKRYRSWLTVSLIVGIIAISIILSMIWTHMVAYIDINSNPQANIIAQKSFMIREPLTYLHTLYHTFLTNTQSPLSNLFGNFIWDSAALPAIFAYLATAAVVLSLLVQSSREKVAKLLVKRESTIFRTSLLLISLITAVTVASALYIYSTTVHQSSIVGLQSRYFLPLLPLVLLTCYGNTVKNQRTVKISIVVISCIVLIGMLLTVHARLYQDLPLIV